MIFAQVVFYLLAFMASISAVMVISVRNTVESVLWLVLVFIATAGLWILAQAEFLGLVLILVYVGAVMVLFLFVVMMLDINVVALKAGFTKYLPIGAIASITMFVLIYLVVGPDRFGLEKFPALIDKAQDYSNTREIAIPLYSIHFYSFILAAILLLVSIVAAISLTLRRKPIGEVKQQDISKQVKVNSKDRFKMVKLHSVIEKDIAEDGDKL